jgi:hypothetical protein
MIPMRHSSIFKSRWMALLWAAGIIWFAVDFTAPDGAATGNGADNAVATDVTGSPVTDQDMQALKAFVDGKQ